jgi:P-type Ca2+ transporter type 2C
MKIGTMKIQNVLWYNLQIEKTLKMLETSRVGLSDKQASTRLKVFGFNRLPEPPRRTALKLFLSQFKSFLILILVVAGALSIFLGDWLEAGVILAAMLINVSLGFFQEYKTEQALEKLQKVINHKSRVYREGLIREINSEELVPGDILILEAGFQVSADLRLIEANNLSVAEAILTGESNPIEKQVEPLSADVAKQILVADRKNMVFKGTLITEGKGLGAVVSTGKMTEVGKIAEILEKTADEETPMQERLRSFSAKLAATILFLAALILIIGLVRGIAFWEILMVAIAAAVASVPEGLLVAITVILAIGMQRILKKNAVVRRLSAAETLGGATVVCVDKTGTITEGEMSVKQLVDFNDFLTFNDQPATLGDFETLATVTLLCNNAVLEKISPDDFKIIGSPTEKALLAASLKFEWDNQLSKYTRLNEIPFTSFEKIMFTLNQVNGQFWWCAKGAPEVLLAKCGHYQIGRKILALDKAASDHWQELFASYSQTGDRLLAAAYRVTDKPEQSGAAANDFIFLGFWVIHDPVRPEVKQTVELARQAGIRTIMITGDHKLTAMEIARQIGLDATENKVIDGQEMMKLSASELKARVADVAVFARVSPHDKLKIVQALQANGEVVAMTGDGINDAPALKAADIGISVGAASDVAKETSDMVLLDSNFSTIIAAIEQGRIIFQNIKKTIVFTLSDCWREIILIVGCLILKLPLPIVAAQILWINLISDGLPAAALTVEDAEPGVMKLKPEKRGGSLLDRQMKIIIFAIGIFSSLLIFALYYWLRLKNFDWQYTRSLIFAVLGVNSLVYVFSCKSLTRPLWRSRLLSNKFLLTSVAVGGLLVMLPIYLPILQTSLNLGALTLKDWGMAVGLSLIQVILIEIVKSIFNRRRASSKTGH